MIGSSINTTTPLPTIVPLGDAAVLVRFGTVLSETANNAAVALGRALDAEPLPGVLEVAPNLISVLLRFDPASTSGDEVAGELRLRMRALRHASVQGKDWRLTVWFVGPDLDEVARSLRMNGTQFIAAHNAAPLRVLATGFAPGFVYCGMHETALVVPRRTTVRPAVPAGSVLFAAGQTAIAATEMPTGWHVIGRTEFNNFDPTVTPPTHMRAGDRVWFEARP